MMNEKLKRITAATLAGIIMTTGLSTTAFAASASSNKESASAATVAATNMLNTEISEETAHQIAKDILNETYDYSDTVHTRSATSTGVKTVLKFIKKNWPKISKILKKYGVKAAEGKGVVKVINDILDGVIDVDDSIDGAIYAVVDYVAPNLNENAKQIIVNAIRLISPV